MLTALRPYLLLVVFGFAPDFASAQEAVTVRVQDTSLGRISPLAVTGFNYGLSMQVALYAEEFGALNLRAVRFPPGEQGDEILLTAVVIDAFKVQWQLMGEPQLMIVANLFSGTPEDAVAAARLFEARGMAVEAWEIGNEPNLYATNRLDPSWTPETYCEHLRAYREALLSVNPEWKIAGPAVSGGRPEGLDYLREVLFLCGDAIDVLSWHVWPTDGTWEDERALWTSSDVGEEIRLLRSWFANPEMNPLGHERDFSLAITEFGLSWRTPNYRHLEDMPAALWLADALGQMAVNGLDEGYYFVLQGLGGHGLIDNAGWVRPTYYLYHMLVDFAGQALAVELEAPISAYAAQNARGLQVLLVNRTAEDAEVVLEAELEGEVEIMTMNDEIFDALLEYQMTVQGADAVISVPARSVLLVRATPGER